MDSGETEGKVAEALLCELTNGFNMAQAGAARHGFDRLTESRLDTGVVDPVRCWYRPFTFAEIPRGFRWPASTPTCPGRR